MFDADIDFQSKHQQVEHRKKAGHYYMYQKMHSYVFEYNYYDFYGNVSYTVIN